MNTYQKNIELRNQMLEGQEKPISTYISFVDDLEHLKEESLRMKAWIINRFDGGLELKKDDGSKYVVEITQDLKEIFFLSWAKSSNTETSPRGQLVLHARPPTKKNLKGLPVWKETFTHKSTLQMIFNALVDRYDTLNIMTDAELEDLIIECDMWNKC